MKISDVYLYMYHVSYIYKSNFLMYWPTQKKNLKSFAIPSLLNLPNISDPKTFNKQHVESVHIPQMHDGRSDSVDTL